MARNAIADLYERAGHLVHRRCVRMLRDPEEAADVTHWVFVRAIEIGFEHRSDGESLSWLYATATRRCLHLLRDGGNRTRLRAMHGERLHPSAPPDAEDELGSRQELQRMLSLVDERTAEIALATYVMGLSNDRAAEMFQVSVRTVGRARQTFEAVVRQSRAEEVS
ncbi:MAG: sigma-70 family RNA polymerase sigma factor [Alphaproteobacteria bacterium]|nr:sigma-70 family RNA polymerase sigma factor [Alphaproteobacteria bacterium]MCB9695413.1 sigma-70 family RNA polymerase sigma factor [Alphaproteobacteria bacterium]